MTETRTICDSNGRTIECELVQQVEIDGQAIGVMLPMDVPVVLYANGEDGAPDRALDPWWEHMEKVDALSAVLREDGVELALSGVTLTARADDLRIGELQLLAEVGDDDNAEGPGEGGTHTVLVEVDGRYGLAIPLDPLLFLAALDEHGGVALDEAADRDLRTRAAAALLQQAK